MGQLVTPTVVRAVVRATSKAALVAAATKEREQQTIKPSCERVLVVYGENAAKLYIEKTPPTPRPAVSRRSA